MATSTPLRHLSELILDSGIQNTNYFNGRVLGAGDLQTDQSANRLQHEQLGKAIGAGVVRGLQVRLASDGSDGQPPVLAVGKGLALNELGEAVDLPIDVQVALARRTQAPVADAGLFADCAPPSTSVVPVLAGLYILTLQPGSGYSGSAPMVGFDDACQAASCGARYAVEGAEFRLLQLDIATLAGVSAATRAAITALLASTDAASRSRLRNWVAHLCFGTEELAALDADPFGADPALNAGATGAFERRYGAIDALRSAGTLSTSEVPLALLQWTVQGVQYLDMWSVRRETAVPSPSRDWPLPADTRRRREARARALQFAEHVDALLQSGLSDAAIAGVQAAQWLRYLPPAALIPVTDGLKRGFDWRVFLTGVTYGQAWFIEGAKLQSLVDRAVSYPPIDPMAGELVRVYLVRENIQAIDDATAIAPTQYVVLVNGQLGFEGQARFDLNRWDYANFT